MLKYESGIEQDRRVMAQNLSEYAQRQELEHDRDAMLALLAGVGVEHVTCWTVDGRAQHRTVMS